MAANAGRFEARVVIFLGLAFLSCLAEGSLHGHRIGNSSLSARRGLVDTAATVFDVTKFGAKADDKTDNVEAFMQAWIASCKSNGPAKLVFPQGTYLTGPVVFQGPCNNSQPITVEVQGTIKATIELGEYSSDEWFLFEQIDGLILTGSGTFDGQGVSVWKYNDCHGNPRCSLLPSSIKFNRVNNSVIHEINSINSKSFHFFIVYCNNITVHSINITAPANSPNTGGIHLSKSNLVNISSSLIGTGDDCISIGQGSTNISISNIFCGPGHGISIGSLGKYPGEEDVSGIVVTNCTLSNTTNGVRIKTWAASPPSEASSIVFEDIKMDRVKNPIIIDQKYGSHKIKPSQVKISSVHYKNIRGTSTSNVAVSLSCSALVPCEGVELVDIDLAYNGASVKNMSLSSSCLNANFTAGGKQSPPACR